MRSSDPIAMNVRFKDRCANRRGACGFLDLRGLVQFPNGVTTSAPPIMSLLTRSTYSIRIFGWGKSVGGLRKTKLKGRRRTWDGSYLIMAAYNLTRMTRLRRLSAA